MHEESHQTRPARASATHALSAGARIDNAEIVGLIGSSPAAIVYLAHDASTGKRLALREYMPHGLATRMEDGSIRPTGDETAAVFAAGLRSFINEALVLSRLSVPSLLGFDRYSELHGTAYAFMPFHEGSTLDAAVTDQDFAPDETWIRMLVARLLDAAEAVQRAQSCHGNIHPGNILIRPDGAPLLLEFDAAQATIGEIIHSPTGMLATGYAAPEQHFNAKARDIGAWTDIYAIGATAYFLVTGHPPPYAMQRFAQEGMLPALHAARSSHSRGLLAAIGRALAVHPEHRFQTIAEMRAALVAERQIVMPAAPSILRADNARAAMQTHRETMASAAHPDKDATTMQATQINPASVRAPHTPSPDMQAHNLPALPDSWRKPVPADELRGGRSRGRGRSALWVSSLLLVAGVSVGLGAGYLHFNADDNSAAQESADGRSGASGSPADKDTQLATASPDAATAASRNSGNSMPAAPVSPVPPSAKAAATTAAATTAAAPAASGAQIAATSTPSAAGRNNAVPAAPVAPAAKLAQPPLPQTAEATEASKEAARVAVQEQDQWRIASYVDQPVSYETYLKRYPNGRYASAAREKLAALQPRPEQRSSTAVATTEVPERTASAATAGTAPSPATVAASPAGRSDRTDARTSAARDAGRQPPATAAKDDDPPPVPAPAVAGGTGNSRVIRLDGQTMTGNFLVDASTGVVSGTGRIEWSNGDRFDGTLVRGSKEGKGQFVWRSGQRYSGDWSGNEPNGRGTIVFANGNRYDGEVRNGLPNGRGALVFADKTRYEGDIRSGVPNGKGTMIFADGTRYEGDVRNGMPHGQGVTRFRNGDVYVGAVAQGRSNGHGRFSWSNGTAWEGEFRDGQRTENGRLLTAMNRSAMSSGGSPGAVVDGSAGETGSADIVTK